MSFRGHTLASLPEPCTAKAAPACPHKGVLHCSLSGEGDSIVEVEAALLPRARALHSELQARLQQLGLPPVVVRPLQLEEQGTAQAATVLPV